MILRFHVKPECTGRITMTDRCLDELWVRRRGSYEAQIEYDTHGRSRLSKKSHGLDTSVEDSHSPLETFLEGGALG